MAEREEETWVEEEVAWAEKASQLLPFLADSLIVPEGIPLPRYSPLSQLLPVATHVAGATSL